MAEISYKLFAGFLVSSELRMNINSSSKWKEHQILQNKDLQLVHFEDKDYMGYYLEPAYLALNEINSLENGIRNALDDFFPKYHPDSLTLYFFTQAFIL